MTSDRYDTSGDPGAKFEPGSNNTGLKNKLGIQNADEMELDLLIQRYDAIPEEVESDQPLTSKDIREWHRRWLGNVYSWAG